MRILFDTNILIAAFITEGKCSELLEHCLRKHKIISSEFILAEFHKHLVQKFKFSETESQEAINLLRMKIEIVTPVEMKEQICRDQDDDNIIASAIAGEADCIITGDKDLLILKKVYSIDIINPSEFSFYESSEIN